MTIPLLLSTLLLSACNEGDRGPAGPKGEPGETGTTGAQEPTGETGATGPAGVAGVAGVDGANGLDGAQIVSSISIYDGGTTVTNGASLVFDTITYSTGNISYNAATGIVTFNEARRYWIQGQVSNDGLPGAPDDDTAKPTTFALSSSQGDFLASSTLLSTGLPSGSGIIDVVVAPATLSLVNASSYGVVLPSSTSPQANIAILRHSPDPDIGLMVQRTGAL